MVFLTGVRCWFNQNFKVSPSRYFKRMQFKRLAAKYMGRSRNCYVLGVRIMNRANRFSTQAQATKPAQLERLYDMRIMAGCHEHGLDKTYFLTSLAESDVNLNRQTLSNLAIYEPRTYQGLTEFVKARSLEIGLQTPKVGAKQGLETRGILDKIKDSS